MTFSQAFNDFLKENTNYNIIKHTLRALKEESYYVKLDKISYVDVVNGTLLILASNRVLNHLDNGTINYANFQEISCGKFFRKILTTEGICELDCEIETVHLLFNLHFNKTKLDFKISRDFFKIYNSVRKGENSSVLCQSCMNNKSESYFKIYEKIPECKIIAAYSDNKLVARALLWEIEGDFYVDRIYSMSSYIEKLFIEYTKEMRFIRKYEQSYNYKNYWVDYEDNHFAKNLKIPFDDEDVSSFPYVDTFTYLNSKDKFLHNGGHKATSSLTYTDGNCETLRYKTIGETDDIEYCKISKEWGRDFIELSAGTFKGQRVLRKNVVRLPEGLYHVEDPDIVYFLNVTGNYQGEYILKSTLNNSPLARIKRFGLFVKYEDFLERIDYESTHIFSKSVLHNFLNIYPGQAWQSLVEVTE